MISRLREALSLIVSVYLPNIKITSQNHAQSTELAEYVRKTVRESGNDLLDKKLEPVKVKKNKSQNFRQIMFFQGLRLGAGGRLSCSQKADLRRI